MKKEFLAELNRLEENIVNDHATGACNHDGYCGLVPVLREFLESPQGRQSLESIVDWYDPDKKDALYFDLVFEKLDSKDWIHPDEMSAWLTAVRKAGQEFALVDQEN